ncbi:tagatose 1,6-diphosphate aldolase [Candidatus Woesearchaeota archaeon]|nr:tagatose 1,6-diphosphate aldolase [Candidatus Woesearchaeota archaeon]MBW3005800.1 tagatose 1,6-diphosphate aldolase [Candidatus Woesearchaeota archaeon]
MNLKKLQDKNGNYTMLALDQRGSFVRACTKTLGKKPTKKQVTEAKKRIIKAIGKYPSAILLDPIYCLPLAKLVPKALLFCVEKSGYVEKPQGRKTQLQPNWGVKQAVKKGAVAVKINILYNPEASKDVVKHQQKIAEKVGKACKKHNVPYLLEFVVYPLKGDFKKKLPDLVYRSAKEFSKKKYNAAILKLQYPGNLKTCKKITKNIKQPWILLTAGIPFKDFAKQLKIAKKGGCSGFLAGRAVWQDALKIKSIKKQNDWLKTKGVKNIKTLLRIMQ